MPLKNKDTMSISEKLNVLVNTEGDAGIMFRGAVKLSKDFEIFVDSIYKNFVLRDPNAETINRFGLISFQAWHTLKKISKEVNTCSRDEYLDYISNGLVLTHGYIIFFNQLFDDGGILEKYLNKNISEKAQELKASKLDILSMLESASPTSLELRRSIEATKIINKKSILKDIEILTSAYEQYKGSKFEEVEHKLNSIYSSLDIKSNKDFLKYLAFFNLEYFPLVEAISLLKHIETTNNEISVTPQSRKKQDNVSAELQRIYNAMKFWKDITGLIARTSNAQLYFDILKEYAAKNKIELYSPIRIFLERIMEDMKDRKYKKLYNLDDINEAKMEFEIWRNILGY